jgi:hypothetical protein
MKAKSNQKLTRRAAGLPIRASLDPRPDLGGTNPATDIFRAVAATAMEKKENLDEIVRSSSDDNSAQEIERAAPFEVSEMAETFDKEPKTALVTFAEGQMRVVSLRQQKRRKVEKPKREPFKILTVAPEVEKIPQLFERTKAEELYDLLYHLTLGADKPCASVRVKRSDLMLYTNIKTRITLDLNLKRLEENNLIKIESRPGEQEGNIYTVFPLPQKTLKS